MAEKSLRIPVGSAWAGSAVEPDAATTRMGPFPGRWRWPLLLIVVVGAGLVLRLATAGMQPMSLIEWLPWINPPTVTIYLPDSQARFLVPVTRRVAEDRVTPAGAIEELLKSPKDNRMLAALFPLQARLSNLEIQDGLALVEVTTGGSEDGGNLPAPMAVKALARTLGDFEEVETVRLLLNGEGLGESPVRSRGTGGGTMFYTYGSYLVPVPVPASDPEQIIRLYLEGSGIPALVGLPEDVRLLEYRFDADRGLIYTSFTYTESLRQMATENPEGIRRSLTGIIATLTGLPEVQAIMLDFEGHSRLGLGQCSDLLRAPQVEPRILNDEALLLKQ